MAVKLIDLYLMKRNTLKNKLQLLAASALLLSSKIEVCFKKKKTNLLYNFYKYYIYFFLDTRFRIFTRTS